MPKTIRSPNNKQHNGMQTDQENDDAPVTRDWMRMMMEQNNKQFHEHLNAMTTSIHTAFNTKIVALEEEIVELKQQNSDQERRIEHLERNQRRFNIKVSQLDAPREDVPHIIATALNTPELSIRDVIPIKTKTGATKFVATCSTSSDKAVIMAKKKLLTHNGRPFFVDNDLTRKEEEIQYKLRRFASEQGPKGSAAVAYKRVYTRNGCYEYNEATQKIEEKKNFPKRP